MFNDCKNLSELNLSSFNTNNVIYMSEMFYDCNDLNKVIINKLNIKEFKEEINISKIKF
jgi:surface protein